MCGNDSAIDRWTRLWAFAESIAVDSFSVGQAEAEALRQRLDALLAAPPVRPQSGWGSKIPGSVTDSYGSAKATMLLPDGAPFLPPPQAITTYCRPSIM